MFDICACQVARKITGTASNSKRITSGLPQDLVRVDEIGVGESQGQVDKYRAPMPQTGACLVQLYWVLPPTSTSQPDQVTSPPEGW